MGADRRGVGQRLDPCDDRTMVDRGVSPLLVGRRHEIELLTEALSRAIAGEPALVLVGGEA
jgi:hypothetical protein